MKNHKDVERAFFPPDVEWIGMNLKNGVPLKGYSRGYTIAHLAVTTGELNIVKLCEKLLGQDWSSLVECRNDDNQTPRELAEYLEYFKICNHLDDSLNPETKNGKVLKAQVNPRESMPIEQELEEQRLDGFGAKCRTKLNANANGKPYWNK